MVKALLLPTISSPIASLHSGEGGLGRPNFERLVGWDVVCGLSLYEDRKDELVKDLGSRRDELDGLASSTLQSLNLPGSLQASVQPVGLPPSLIAKSEELHSEGGSERLRSMMSDVRRIARTNNKIVDEVRFLLSSFVHCD